MKTYRITYLRVGGKELWAGWRIAAMSQGISGNALDTYRNLQAANSSIEIMTEQYDSASVIYEFVCVRGTVFFSKLTYGIKDKIGRASMRADGLVVSLGENPGLFKNISSILAVPDSVFDNKVTIDSVYSDLIAEKGDASSLTEKDIVNTLDGFELLPTVERNEYVFSDQSIKEQVVTAVYWAILNKSSSTLWLVAGINTAEKLDLIAEIFSYLPYPLRAKAMFHTSVVNPKKPMQLELSHTRPKMGYFVNLETGENNLRMLTKRISGYSFVSYIFSLPDKTARFEYFEKLHQKMTEMGSAVSEDLEFIQTAHVLLMDEGANPEVLSDIDLVKKLHSSLQITPANNTVDSFCADLMKRIIDRNSVIQQDFVYETICEKLILTSCPDFINYGSTIVAGWLWRSPNIESSYDFLSRLNAQTYQAVERKLLQTSNGAAFIESYYINRKGSQLDEADDLQSALYAVSDYLASSIHLPQTSRIRKTAANRYSQIGENILVRYDQHEADLKTEVPLYLEAVRSNLSEYYPQLKARLFERFWDCFELKRFHFAEIPNYDVMRDNSHKSRFVSAVVRRFKEIYFDQKAETSVVLGLKRIFKDNSNLLEEQDIINISKEFQDCCLLNITNKDFIDFWYSVAKLSGNGFLVFILCRKIEVFTNPSIFRQQISVYRFQSVYFNRDENLDYLYEAIKNYIDENKKDKSCRSFVETAVEMYEVVAAEKKVREEIVKTYTNNHRRHKTGLGILGKLKQ